MEQTSIGKRIIENFERDSKVPGKTWEKFLKNLITRLKKGDSGIDAISKAIKEDMLLKGPPVEKKHLDESFSKIMKVRSLFRYLNDNLPIFRDRKSQEQVCEWIENGKIKIAKHFKDIKLQGEQPIVWATFTNEIENQENMGLELNALCDKLGLLDFNKCEYVVELNYESGKVKNVRFPTTMEGGTAPAFNPSDDDEYGYTWDLKNRDWGLPEVVHEPISFKDIDTINCKGHKDKDATSLF
jgi:hypothetical protein